MGNVNTIKTERSYMNIKILLTILALAFTSQLFAGEDYYDFQWEIKNLKEKQENTRDLSSVKEEQEKMIVVENSPIIFELND